MWIILGLIAIVSTFINLYMYARGKDYKFAMAMGSTPLWEYLFCNNLGTIKYNVSNNS